MIEKKAKKRGQTVLTKVGSIVIGALIVVHNLPAGGNATHSNILTWKIWTEEPELQAQSHKESS